MTNGNKNGHQYMTKKVPKQIIYLIKVSSNIIFDFALSFIMASGGFPLFSEIQSKGIRTISLLSCFTTKLIFITIKIIDRLFEYKSFTTWKKSCLPTRIVYATETYTRLYFVLYLCHCMSSVIRYTYFLRRCFKNWLLRVFKNKMNEFIVSLK